MKSLGLIVFLVVGLAIAWLISNRGMSAGTAFAIAFLPAAGAGFLADKLASGQAERK